MHKIISDLNRFRFGVMNLQPGNGKKVHWYFLLHPVTERIRCFTDDEVAAALRFLNIVSYAEFGGVQTNCFTNNTIHPCNNDTCEEDIAILMRPVPIQQRRAYKFKRSTFTHPAGVYTLGFDIIGYVI